MPPRKNHHTAVERAPSRETPAKSAPSSNGSKKKNGNGSSAQLSSAKGKAPGVRPDRAIIEFRAWEIWQSEGCPQGRELEHWLQAEREVAAAVRD